MTTKLSHPVLLISLAAALGMGYGTTMAQSAAGSSTSADQAKSGNGAGQAGQAADSQSRDQASKAGEGASGMSGSATQTGTPGAAGAASDESASPEDQSITRQVKEALESEGIKSDEVTVETRDGVVTITGDLSAKELKKAKQVTRDLDGVKDVKISEHKAK